MSRYIVKHVRTGVSYQNWTRMEEALQRTLDDLQAGEMSGCRLISVAPAGSSLPSGYFLATWERPLSSGEELGAALVEHAEQQASRVRDIEAQWVTWGSGYTKHLPAPPGTRLMRCGATAWDPPYPPPTDSTARECHVCRSVVNAS